MVILVSSKLKKLEDYSKMEELLAIVRMMACVFPEFRRLRVTLLVILLELVLVIVELVLT